MLRNLLVAVGIVTLVSGCSMFDASKPAPLPNEPPVKFEIEIKQLWFKYLSQDPQRDRDPYQLLEPVVLNGTAFAIGRAGNLVALNLDTGQELFTAQLPESISAGLSTDGQSLFVGTDDGELIALDLTATELWRAELTSRMLRPAVANDKLVIAQTQDGKVAALDRQTGQQLWLYDSGIPRLTIMGTSQPILTDDDVIASFANGKLVSLDAKSGQIQWEHRLAESEGRSELDRLTDSDGSPTRVQNFVIASAINGQTLAVDLASGRRLVNFAYASDHRIVAAAGQFNLILEDDTLLALSPQSHDEVWRQEALQGRNLTDAVVWGDYLAFADRRGWLILADPADGSLVGAIEADHLGIASAPVVAGDIILVQGRSGRLKAFSLK